MELLNLKVKPFCRTVWVSEKARSVWASAIPQINQLVQKLEVLSVKEGHRLAAWQTIRQDRLVEIAARWADMGLVSLPIKAVRAFQGFSHYHEAPIPGDPSTNVCAIVTKDPAVLVEYKKAHAAGDNVTQGRLLGFPKCCCEFFEHVWENRHYDPIWQAAKRSNYKRYHKGIRSHIIEGVKAHPFSNPMLRYLGVRLGFHIPCSFECKDTIESGEKRFELGLAIDSELMVLLGSLLRMPMSWDCLKGIAVVRTPIFYTIVGSVPYAERRVVEVEGDFVPRESKKGCTYPFSEVK